MVITLPAAILHYDYGLDLSGYSGFGEALREVGKRKAWTIHDWALAG